MRNQKKLGGITAKVVVALLVLAVFAAACATYVPIKFVKQPTIGGMDAVKNMGIRNFENKSGNSIGNNLAQYLSDQANNKISATGKFTIVAANDPNAEGIFYGEIRSVRVSDSQRNGSYKDTNENTIYYTDYTREVSVEFVYGVINARTNMPFGTVTKSGSTTSSARDDRSLLRDPTDMARSIVSSRISGLEKDIVPTIESTNMKLMDETSKDKIAKQRMKDAKELVKQGRYEDAISLYDEIGTDAAKANSSLLKRAIESDISSRAQMAELDSKRTGLVDGAVNKAVADLTSKLPAGSIIMILQTNSNERATANDVVDRVTKSIVQDGKLKVVDRSNQRLIDAEQNFQMSGKVDDSSAVLIGKQLGAKYAVLCWVSGTMSSRRLNIKVLSIETSVIEYQSDVEI